LNQVPFCKVVSRVQLLFWLFFSFVWVKILRYPVGFQNSSSHWWIITTNFDATIAD